MSRNIVEELGDWIGGELNQDFDFYILSDYSPDNSNEVDRIEFFLFSKVYDSDTVYIIAISNWYNIGELFRYKLHIDSIVQTKREFRDIVKSAKREILLDLLNTKNIIIIPRKENIVDNILDRPRRKVIVNNILKYQRKFYNNYTLERR